MSVQTDKGALRRRMRATRAAIPSAVRDVAGRAALRQLTAQLQPGITLLCYVSTRTELPTRALLGSLAERYELAVPRVQGADMHAVRYTGTLVDGAYGVPTSLGEPVDEIDAVLTPGLAFDLDGGRVGYGAGYYDRWFAAHPDALAIGLCFDAQVVGSVPIEEHDRGMDWILTPTRLVKRL